MNVKDYIVDDLKTMNFLGEIVDNNDPEKLGRCKIKVFGKFDLIPTESLPWAYPGNCMSFGSSSGGGSFSSPKIGVIVSVYFDNGNIYCPIYTYIQMPSEELKTEIGEDILNFHSLIYDTEIEGGLKVYYSQNEEKGLFINLKDTKINIRNDNEIKITNPNGDIITLKNDGTLEINTSKSITVNSKEAVINAENNATITTNNAKIESGKIELGNNAVHKVILGDLFRQLFNNHIHSAVGNLGAPVMTSSPTIKMTTDYLSDITKTE